MADWGGHVSQVLVWILHWLRDCVIQRFAMLEIRLVIVKLFTRYQFSTTLKLEKILDSAKNGLVIEARDGIHLLANQSPRLPNS